MQVEGGQELWPGAPRVPLRRQSAFAHGLRSGFRHDVEPTDDYRRIDVVGLRADVFKPGRFYSGRGERRTSPTTLYRADCLKIYFTLGKISHKKCLVLVIGICDTAIYISVKND